MRLRPLLATCGMAILACVTSDFVQAQDRVSASDAAFIDMRTHPDPKDARASVRAALETMRTENAGIVVLMPPPFTFADTGRFEAEEFLRLAREAPDRLVVFGGGGSLNPMIQESVRTGEVGAAVRARFRRTAEDLLRSGAAGFGELSVEHFVGATAYQSAPADHPLFLLLADIAAEHGVPIVLHMEAIPHDMPLPAPLQSPPNAAQLRGNIDAFGRLLAHNRGAPILWAHAGWDNSGYRTPELCRTLLRANTNLYMDLKVDPAHPGLQPLQSAGASGAIRPEWLALLREFPDRFVVGTDQHYPVPATGPQRWQAISRFLALLPDDLRAHIARENAQRLLGRSMPTSAP